MRWSVLDGKMVINVRDGRTLGMVNDADLVIDERTGAIRELLIPRGGLFSFFGGGPDWVIPWDAIRQIGPEVILVDVTLSDDPHGLQEAD